ncbi:MAG: F0F1 ATP synthase subunit C [Holosporales bacterium]|jgi:F-type H+-transporting ATPase subunit c|nr:F0F1 ATP synthase subunit C [Holosporales bacterium]
MDVSAFKYMGAGVAMLALLGVALGLGKIFSAACDAIGRNPSAKSDLFTLSMIGGGFVEALGLFTLIVAVLILVM